MELLILSQSNLKAQGDHHENSVKDKEQQVSLQVRRGIYKSVQPLLFIFSLFPLPLSSLYVSVALFLVSY